MADDDVNENDETTEDDVDETDEEVASEESTEDSEDADEEVAEESADEAEDAEDETEAEDTEESETADDEAEDEAEETDEDEELEEDETDEEKEEEELEEVESSMEEGDGEDEEETQTKPVVKSDQQYYGTGRRKESVARVWIEAGDGNVTVNDKSVDEYFQNRKKWTKAVRSPLETVGFEEDIDVWATAEGGGLTGQADAVKLGIARALCEMDENARTWLRSDDHLTRDDREVERKKINQPGARAKQQVSKR